MLRILLVITLVFLAAYSKANELNVPIDAQNYQVEVRPVKALKLATSLLYH